MFSVDTNNYYRTVTADWRTTDEELESLQNIYKPEWATEPATITQRAGKFFIVWVRDQKIRPFLP